MPALEIPPRPAPDVISAADGNETLRIESLTVVIDSNGAVVLRDASLRVRAGEVLGLVGESGCGKTTLALAALGHTRPGLRVTSGSVMLDGVELLGLPKSKLQTLRGARVAYVPQDPASALNPALKVGPQLRETLTKHLVHLEREVDVEQRLQEVLGQVRLEEHTGLLDSYPHQLSGGQQQRVALAMAFVCQPRLIVLDEPTTGLDVTTQRRILDTIRSLCQTYGVAALYVTHDLAVVREISDRVVVMYAGELMEIGPTQSIFGSPEHPYTRALLHSIPTLDRARFLEGMDGQPPRPSRRPAGCSFAARCRLVGPECQLEVPPLLASSNGRQVRCLCCGRTTASTSKREEADNAVCDNASETPVGEVLKISSLTARYAWTPVLQGVDLVVGKEQCLALVGESGSGKTTLARCVVGLHKDWAGSISFGGEDLAQSARERPRHVLRHMQYVFQNPYTSLNPRKTIEQIVSQPLSNLPDRYSRREARQLVQEALDEVSLGADYLRQFPHQLSGGERQRVAIARALVMQPSLLVCDEVTSALDVSVQAIVVELLRRLQHERRLSILFITHNLSLVRNIAQQVAVLEKGCIVEVGPTEAVLERPQHEYTVRLLRDVPKIEVPR